MRENKTLPEFTGHTEITLILCIQGTSWNSSMDMHVRAHIHLLQSWGVTRGEAPTGAPSSCQQGRGVFQLARPPRCQALLRRHCPPLGQQTSVHWCRDDDQIGINLITKGILRNARQLLYLTWPSFWNFTNSFPWQLFFKVIVRLNTRMGSTHGGNMFENWYRFILQEGNVSKNHSSKQFYRLYNQLRYSVFVKLNFLLIFTKNYKFNEYLNV